jgi:glucan phosphoethanolaminetransferase (alkaline phosphatase superfamily)
MAICVERVIRVVAGSFILISVALEYFVNKWCLLFAAFVGLNLFQFGFSDFCPMKDILLAFGVSSYCGLQADIPILKVDATALEKLFNKMNVARWIRVFAGSFVCISVVLTYLVSEWAVLLALFVGANLFQFGFTNQCPMATILRYLGVGDQEKVPNFTDVSPVEPAEKGKVLTTEMV